MFLGGEGKPVSQQKYHFTLFCDTSKHNIIWLYCTRAAVYSLCVIIRITLLSFMSQKADIVLCRDKNHWANWSKDPLVLVQTFFFFFAKTAPCVRCVTFSMFCWLTLCFVFGGVGFFSWPKSPLEQPHRERNGLFFQLAVACSYCSKQKWQFQFYTITWLLRI